MRGFGRFAARLALFALVCAALVGVWRQLDVAPAQGAAGSRIDPEALRELIGALPEGEEAPLLVNAEHPLPEDYAPGELVNLYEQKRHFRLASSEIYLAREAFEAANAMFEAAEREDLNGFILTSGYRSPEKQAEVFADQNDGTAAEPGASEHETGLAFDVTAYSDGDFTHTPQYTWLVEHCWDYGFILRYPEGREDVTGIPFEPWHYRYVGLAHARRIREAGCTLEEYCAALAD